MLFFLTDLTSGKIDPQATVRQKTQVKKEWRLKMICLMSITLRIKKGHVQCFELALAYNCTAGQKKMQV